MSKIPTDRLLLKFDVRTPVIGNRFVVFKDGAYRVGRFVRTGPAQGSRPFVRLGKTPYATLHEAQAAIGINPNPLEAIRHGLAKLDATAKVASHLYGDAFVITKPKGAGQWSYYKAKLTANGVEIGAQEYANRGAAHVQVQREGGPTPTLDLSSLPARPLGLYA